MSCHLDYTPDSLGREVAYRARRSVHAAAAASKG
jgi:hypothetical protein